MNNSTVSTSVISSENVIISNYSTVDKTVKCQCCSDIWLFSQMPFYRVEFTKLKGKIMLICETCKTKNF